MFNPIKLLPSLAHPSTTRIKAWDLDPVMLPVSSVSSPRDVSRCLCPLWAQVFQEKARATSCTAHLPILLYLVYPKLLHAWLRRGTTKATAPESLIFYASKWMPRTVNRLTACLVSTTLLACSGPGAGPKLRTRQFFPPLSFARGKSTV